ncbi:histidine-rich glycoprotein-like, partial [Homarus americanus]|uniref:histidine-rich glycoprotein-like n=1 Tax=Homarus americanus TaxID=6706 RepID=UPI001C438AB5
MGWYVAVMVALLTCRGQGLLLHRSLTQQVLTVTSYYLQVTTCNILLESHYGAADGELPREPRDEWSSSEHSLRQQQQSGEHRLQYYNPTEEALHMHHQQSQGEKPHSLEFLGVRREEDLDEYLHQGPHSQHHHHQSQHQPYHHHHHHLQHLRSSRPSEPHHQNHQQRRDKRNHHRVEKRHQLLQHRLTHHQRLPHPLQFTQSEYRQTVPEDVPLHTSILT